MPDAGATPVAPGLYLVATPIGNLEDITVRALRILRSVDRIACEDTRQTQKLLNHFAISTPTLSYHLHNEAERAAELVAELQAGARIAVVSDAGTPGIADPGSVLVAAAIAAGVAVFPIPGANAAISALVASGLLGAGAAGSQAATEASTPATAEGSGAGQPGTPGIDLGGSNPGTSNLDRFTFHGFLPAKEGQRRTALEALRDDPGSALAVQVFYEAPHRILGALADMEAIYGPAQHVVVARELTKMHEEFLRGPVAEIRANFSSRSSVRGEFVLLFVPTRHTGEAEPLTIAAEVAHLMSTESLSEKDALKRVARARGLGKSDAYREWQRGRNR